jgi:hypothetical protein
MRGELPRRVTFPSPLPERVGDVLRQSLAPGEGNNP